MKLNARERNFKPGYKVLVLLPDRPLQARYYGPYTRSVSCFLNNFEIAIFLLFFKLFIVSFLYYVNVIVKKREPLMKLVFTAFVRFKLRCKMSGVIIPRHLCRGVYSFRLSVRMFVR